MDKVDLARYQDIIVTTATDVGLKVLAAIVFWVVGRWLVVCCRRVYGGAAPSQGW